MRFEKELLIIIYGLWAVYLCDSFGETLSRNVPVDQNKIIGNGRCIKNFNWSNFHA